MDYGPAPRSNVQKALCYMVGCRSNNDLSHSLVGTPLVPSNSLMILGKTVVLQIVPIFRLSYFLFNVFISVGMKYDFIKLPFYSFFYAHVSVTKVVYYCSRRNFGLARNLIRRIISPNQDDLSYSNRASFPGSRNWVSCQTHFFWLNNAVQCRRLTGGSSRAAAAWTHEETYLIYGFLASISLRPRNPSWIWIRYIPYTTHRNNFMSPPKLAMSMRCLIPLPAPSSHFTSGQP